MRTNRMQYETPTLVTNGRLTEATRAGHVNVVEEDQTGMYPAGSVGFGI